MSLIDADTVARVDAAVDTAVRRLQDRMAGLGDGFDVLAEALVRASAGGKRLRPALVVCTYLRTGEDSIAPAPVMEVAAAFELLHTAFVVHDDVIDGDTTRRGVPNIGGEFRARASMRGASPTDAALVGDAAAILAGDLLLHEAQRLVGRADLAPAVRIRVLDLIDEAVAVSAAGELADVEHAALPESPDLTNTLNTARDKTAVYSFSAPMRAGAALAGAAGDVDAALERSGTHLGVSFQLADDLIGAFGTAEQAGRAPGADLIAAKRTPIVAFAQQTDRWPRVDEALALAHTGPFALREAQRELDRSGAARRTRELALEELEIARDAAENLPPGLRELVDELAGTVEGRLP